MWVSTETIYQSLYVQSRGALRRDLARCLRTGRALRRPCRSPAQRKSRVLPDMINISQRPAEADDRAVPGHWEGDLIIGKRNLTAIGTLVERTTGYTMLVHLPDGYKPEQVRDALATKIQTLPDTVRRSLTWDQGPEMRDWKQVRVAADIEIYFCDPHAPWQRASNENTNGLLRQYFPKGTDLGTHSPADLDAVADELNDRPANDWVRQANRRDRTPPVALTARIRRSASGMTVRATRLSGCGCAGPWWFLLRPMSYATARGEATAGVDPQETIRSGWMRISARGVWIALPRPRISIPRGHQGSVLARSSITSAARPHCWTSRNFLVCAVVGRRSRSHRARL